MNNIVDFYIKAYREKPYPNFDIIKAIEVKKGNNVLYIHKEWNEGNYDYNNIDYVFKTKKKGRLNCYTISHKSGFALSGHVFAPNIHLVVKVAEKLLSKMFFGFFFNYDHKRAYSNAYWNTKLWKYREYKTSAASDLVYDYILKTKGIELYQT